METTQRATIGTPDAPVDDPPLRGDRWFEPIIDEVAPSTWGLERSRRRRRVTVHGSDGHVVRLHAVDGDRGIVAMTRSAASATIVCLHDAGDGTWVVRSRAELPHGLLTVPGGSWHERRGVLELWVSGRWEDQDGIFRLSRHPGGAWSAPLLVHPGEGLSAPCVRRDGDRRLMWFSEPGETGERVVVMTCTDDGSWDEAAVAITPGRVGDPDHAGAAEPAVGRLGEQLVMAYVGRTSRSLLLAASDDGTTWRRVDHLLFRGSAGAPDERALRHPSLHGSADGALELVYGGQAADGVWSVMAAAIDPQLLRHAGDPYEVDPAVLEETLRRLAMVDERHLELRLGAVKFAESGYVSSDGRVEQLFPSSTPVFAILVGDAEHVAKLGRSSAFVEREYDRARVLARHAPVVPMALRYLEDRAVLLSPRIHGEPLDGVAKRDPSTFGRLVRRFAGNAARAMRETLRPYDPSLVDLSTQYPTALLRRLDRFADESAGVAVEGVGSVAAVAAATPRLDGADLPESFVASVDRAKRMIGQPPRWLAYGDADMKCEHQLVRADRGDFLAIDLEYVGWFDLDWLVHVLLHAVVTESAAVGAIRLELSTGRLDIGVERHGTSWDELVDGGWVLRELEGLPIDRERVHAFFTATMVDYLLDYWPERKREALVWYAGVTRLLGCGSTVSGAEDAA